MTKPHRFPNCISSVRYAAVVCPREFDIDYNEAAFHWPSTLPFTFNSPMRLRDASPRRHCSTDCSTFIRKHAPYADIFSSIPSENLYILLKLIELDKFNFLVESRFPSFWLRFEFYSNNSDIIVVVAMTFPFSSLYFFIQKKKYISRNCRIEIYFISHDERYAYTKIIFRDVSESKYRREKQENRDRSVYRKYRMELNRESKAF